MEQSLVQPFLALLIMKCIFCCWHTLEENLLSLLLIVLMISSKTKCKRGNDCGLQTLKIRKYFSYWRGINKIISKQGFTSKILDHIFQTKNCNLNYSKGLVLGDADAAPAPFVGADFILAVSVVSVSLLLFLVF